MKYKKGDLHWEVIVSVVLALVAFAIIFYFAYTSELFSSTNSAAKQACRSSVIARGTIGSRGATAGLVGLECDTFNVCIYKNKPECPSMKTYSDIQYIKVKNKDEVVKAIADVWAEAHWVLGEGQYNWADVYKYQERQCAKIFRIGFDEGIINEQKEKKNFDLDTNNIAYYMATNKPFYGVYDNYWGYISGSLNSPIVEKDINARLTLSLKDQYYYYNLDFSKTYIFISQIKSASWIASSTLTPSKASWWYMYPILIQEDDTTKQQALECGYFLISDKIKTPS